MRSCVNRCWLQAYERDNALDVRCVITLVKPTFIYLLNRQIGNKRTQEQDPNAGNSRVAVYKGDFGHFRSSKCMLMTAFD